MERKIEFVEFLLSELQNKAKYNKTSLEKVASKYGIDEQNHVKEYTELAIVMQARKLAHTAGTVKSRFNKIVELYNSQVNLSHRTSQSMLLQQYSTPAPIGYIGGVFCGMDKEGSYFEPSAGNGLLTISAKPECFIVNEIDDVRRANLDTQGFAKVTNKDATEPFPYSINFDAIITNPPFGKLDIAEEFYGYEINTLDHVMCIRALETMKDNGRAALIIGGHTDWDANGRIQAGKNRKFFSFLHEVYNVIDCINIDGHKLYSRQGTAFNVRLILIAGRKDVPGGFAPLYNPEKDRVVYDFDTLFERVMQYELVPEATDKNSEMDPTAILETEAIALELELELLSLQSNKKNTNQVQGIPVAKIVFEYDDTEEYYVKGSLDAQTYFTQYLKKHEQMQWNEHFLVLLLRQNNRVIGIHKHSSGGKDSCTIDISQIVALTTQANAAAVIIAHNHPSGNTKPSAADIAATKSLSAALKLVKISLLDSLIITNDNNYLSMADSGMALAGTLQGIYPKLKNQTIAIQGIKRLKL